MCLIFQLHFFSGAEKVEIAARCCKSEGYGRKCETHRGNHFQFLLLFLTAFHQEIKQLQLQLTDANQYAFAVKRYKEVIPLWTIFTFQLPFIRHDRN